MITTIPTRIPTTWQDYVKSVSAWEQQILTDVTMDITELWTHLVTREQEWIATSDGSFKNNTGAYAWLLHDGQRTIITCLLYTSPSPRDGATSRMPSSA